MTSPLSTPLHPLLCHRRTHPAHWRQDSGQVDVVMETTASCISLHKQFGCTRWNDKKNNKILLSLNVIDAPPGWVAAGGECVGVDRINEGAYNRGKRRRRVFIPVVARQVNRPPPPHPLPIYTYRNHDGCIYAYYPVCGSFWSHSTSELMGGILSPFLVVLVCRTRWGPDLLLQQEEQQSLYSVLFMKQSFYVFPFLP